MIPGESTGDTEGVRSQLFFAFLEGQPTICCKSASSWRMSDADRRVCMSLGVFAEGWIVVKGDLEEALYFGT